MEQKLIIEEMEMACEARTTEEGKDLYIEGIVAQAEVLNRNGRKYPKAVMAEAVNAYNEEYVSKKKALGELNHPPRPYVDPRNATHIIEQMEMRGNDVWARAKILNTAAGKDVRGLIEGGWLVQASTRGLGNIKKITGMNEAAYNEVTKFKLTVGFDLVQDQSAPGALMDSVYESGIYECLDDGTFKQWHESEIVIPEGTEQQDWEKFFAKLSEKFSAQ